MQSKVFLAVVTLLAVVGIGAYVLSGSAENKDAAMAPVTNSMPTEDGNVPEVLVEQMPTETSSSSAATPSVQEFTMTAYYDDKGVWFSLKEMSVKKGDTVRVKVTNTKGMHDFVIDELGIKKELPLNDEVVVEFTADKTGDFIYYCSKMNHREKGQWGTLKVTE